ncbi:hypothetical protein DFH06DRAFT_1119417 [Mycena polygramma]|nr:hypothetical protein DFH06DRAFT_1119417 [Mycena polygramma]
MPENPQFIGLSLATYPQARASARQKDAISTRDSVDGGRGSRAQNSRRVIQKAKATRPPSSSLPASAGRRILKPVWLLASGFVKLRVRTRRTPERSKLASRRAKDRTRLFLHAGTLLVRPNPKDATGGPAKYTVCGLRVWRELDLKKDEHERRKTQNASSIASERSAGSKSFNRESGAENRVGSEASASASFRRVKVPVASNPSPEAAEGSRRRIRGRVKAEQRKIEGQLFSRSGVPRCVHKPKGKSKEPSAFNSTRPATPRASKELSAQLQGRRRGPKKWKRTRSFSLPAHA